MALRWFSVGYGLIYEGSLRTREQHHRQDRGEGRHLIKCAPLGQEEELRSTLGAETVAVPHTKMIPQIRLQLFPITRGVADFFARGAQGQHAT